MSDNSVQGRLDRIEQDLDRLRHGQAVTLKAIGSVLVKLGLTEMELEQIEGVLAPRTYPAPTGIMIAQQ